MQCRQIYIDASAYQLTCIGLMILIRWFAQVHQSGSGWSPVVSHFTHSIKCLRFQNVCAKLYSSVHLCCSTWMTTWQSCPSVSCSAAQMMPSSGGDPRKTVFDALWISFLLVVPLHCRPWLCNSCCLSVRDDQTVSAGRGLGWPGLPHRGHAPRHVGRTLVDRPVPQLNPRRRSCHYHNPAGLAHTHTHPHNYFQT